jgi:hypothetical protein
MGSVFILRPEGHFLGGLNCLKQLSAGAPFDPASDLFRAAHATSAGTKAQDK